MKKHEIITVADTHHRLVTRAAVRRAGGSDSTWRRAVADGLIVEIHAGVAAVAGAPITAMTLIAAAVSAAGDGALASHRSAAFVLGALPAPRHVIDVIRQRPGTGALRVEGVVVHRPRDLVDLRPARHRGIPITNPVRTLCDLGAVAPLAVDSALQAMLVSGHVSLAAVEAAIIRHSRQGRHGITALRAAAEIQALRRKPPDSVLEEAMARLARRYRLPTLEFHARLAGYEVDFAVVDSPLFLECDGWSSHGLDRDQFEFDRDRNATLVGAGWIPVNFTWLQVTRRPDRVAHKIRDAVAQWAPHLLTAPRWPTRSGS